MGDVQSYARCYPRKYDLKSHSKIEMIENNPFRHYESFPQKFFKKHNCRDFVQLYESLLNSF